VTRKRFWTREEAENLSFVLLPIAKHLYQSEMFDGIVESCTFSSHWIWMGVWGRSAQLQEVRRSRCGAPSCRRQRCLGQSSQRLAIRGLLPKLFIFRYVSAEILPKIFEIVHYCTFVHKCSILAINLLKGRVHCFSMLVANLQWTSVFS